MMNIEVLSTMLDEYGIQVDYALGGNQAIECIQERTELVYQQKAAMFKLVLIDYSMPEMDGPQVANQIRSLFKTSIVLTQDDVPYLCCFTAYAEAAYKKMALKSGMDRFLQKPIQQADLEELILIVEN